MNSFRQFLEQYPAQSFKKGETILLKGDRPTAMYVIESGLVKVYTITSGGDERLVTISREEEDFPVGLALGLVDRAQYFYEAFTTCRIRLVSPEAYLQYVLSDQEIMKNRLIRMTVLLLATHARVNALEQSKASDKIAETLLYMAGQFGTALRAPTTRFKLKVTQQEIANSLGLTRETTNIELKKLEVKKLISHSRKNYILYMEQLKSYLGKDDE
jgi:CRP-like cAMP-binding protein